MNRGIKWMEPVLPVQLNCETKIEEAIAKDESDIAGYHFVDDCLCDSDGLTLEFRECRFERCRFSQMEYRRISFVDCVFEKCEMSNLRLENAAFQRVTFQHCRMTGWELMRCVVMNGQFVSCMMDYFSIAESKMDHVLFADCRLRQSMWSGVRMLKCCFEQTDLSAAQWIHTPLKGLDLSTCRIEGWGIDLFDLRGAKITALQVADLSGLLGVEIVDG